MTSIPESNSLRALLTQRAQLIDAYIAGLPGRADEASRFLASYPAKLAQASRDRAEVLQVLATLGVPAAPLAPRDITTSPGRLELGVAGLSISPGERPSIEDLRLYAGTMRAVYEQAVTQARQATDLVHALEHREQQAVMDTSDLAGVPAVRSDTSVGSPPPYADLVGQVVVVTYAHHPGKQIVGRLTAIDGGTLELRDRDERVVALPTMSDVSVVLYEPVQPAAVDSDPTQPDPAIPGIPPDRPDLPCPYCGHKYGPIAADQDIATHLAVCPGPPSNPAIAAGIDHGATWINDHRDGDDLEGGL